MSVPVFFTKEDFYGRLLPGYATIILANYFSLFPRISNDISVTVLFIVEGPVVGYILCSFTSFICSIITSFGKKDYTYKKAQKDYAKIRVKATERQISELDSTLSTYQFCISTGFAFIFLSLYKIYVVLGNLQEVKIPLLALAGGILLMFIAKYELEDFRNIFWELHKEIIGDHKENG
jgi:Na+/H+ antiporter NhaD/arsenite permease-like protein